MTSRELPRSRANYPDAARNLKPKNGTADCRTEKRTGDLKPKDGTADFLGVIRPGALNCPYANFKITPNLRCAYLIIALYLPFETKTSLAFLFACLLFGLPVCFSACLFDPGLFVLSWVVCCILLLRMIKS